MTHMAITACKATIVAVTEFFFYFKEEKVPVEILLVAGCVTASV